MTQYNGYVSIPHSSYSEWKTNTLGNGYDADGLYGNQCWDYVSEFWYNAGFGTGYPITGGDDAKGIWLNRDDNTGDKFTLVYNLNEVQVGDVVCFSIDPYGHVGFVDEVYSGGDYIKILSQNVSNQQYVTVDNYPVSTFQGAFRYKGWHEEPPTPSASGKTKFPWVLYARKIRARTRT